MDRQLSAADLHPSIGISEFIFYQVPFDVKILSLHLLLFCSFIVHQCCRMGDDDGTASTTRSSAAVAENQIQQHQQSPVEKLLLSFENPNYQLERQFKSMDQARIDDHLNSNIAPANMMYDELCRELKIYTDLSGESIPIPVNQVAPVPMDCT